MDEQKSALKRELGLAGATLLGLGSILGTGVFVSVGVAAGFAGNALPGAVAIAALLAVCNALSSAQLAAAYPVSGGAYEYGYRLLRPEAGFLAGWMFLCAKTASASAAAIGAASYGLAIFGVSSEPVRAACAGAIAVAVAAVAAAGLRLSNAINIAVVSLAILSLGVLIFVSLFREGAIAAADIAFFPDFRQRDSGEAFLTAVALMFVAYTGYGRIATMGEEVREPRRTIPRAIIVTLAVSALLYGLVSIAGLAAIGPAGLANAVSQSATPLSVAAERTAGPVAGLILSVGAVSAMLGVLLNLVLGLSRVVLAMSRRGDLPAPLAAMSGTSQPVKAVLLIGTAVAVLAVAADVKTAWTFSALTVLMYYAVANLAALRVAPSERLYPRWVPVCGLAGCLMLTAFIPLSVWGAGLVLTAAGFGLRTLFRSAASKWMRT